MGKEIVLSTLSTLLVTSSVFLPIDLRTQIERITCSALIVLQQGILRLNYSNDQTLISHYHTLLSINDHTTPSTSSSGAASGSSSRSSGASSSAISASNAAAAATVTSATIRSTNKLRIRRHTLNCEPLRYDASLQNDLLTIALYELTSLYGNGNRSANLCLVKEVCQLCSQYPETQRKAREVLLTIECLSFPSGGGCGGSYLSLLQSQGDGKGVNEMTGKVFQELSSPQEDVYVVNQMIPVIQREREKVEDFIANFGRERERSFAVETVAAAAVTGAGFVSESMAVVKPEEEAEERAGEGEEEEKRTPTPYPVTGGQGVATARGGVMKPIPPLAQGRGQMKETEESTGSDEDDELLPEINLADPDVN
jgi:hypothetical protein